MTDMIIVLGQFLLLSIFCKDKDIKIVSALLSIIFISNILLFGTDYYYQRQIFQDVLMIVCLYQVKDNLKWLITTSICAISLCMNFYELQSYYQTFLYPYRDNLQWWMVEALFATLCWKVIFKEKHEQICNNNN